VEVGYFRSEHFEARAANIGIHQSHANERLFPKPKEFIMNGPEIIQDTWMTVA
jgi:hypothetical protein